MKNQLSLNVISVPESLDLSGLYCLINKLFLIFEIWRHGIVGFLIMDNQVSGSRKI